jgi:hypothetical protein
MEILLAFYWLIGTALIAVGVWFRVRRAWISKATNRIVFETLTMIFCVLALIGLLVWGNIYVPYLNSDGVPQGAVIVGAPLLFGITLGMVMPPKNSGIQK